MPRSTSNPYKKRCYEKLLGSYSYTPWSIFNNNSQNHILSFLQLSVNVKVHDFYPFPKRQILELSKFKEFADDNFEFDENGGKFSKRIEKKKKKTVGKGEIARYEQFLLFPQCFR